MERGIACDTIRKELEKQLEATEEQRVQDSLKILDYMLKESKYMENDSLRLGQIDDKQKLADLYKKRGRRDKWIWGGAGLGAGILVGILLGIFAN